MSKKKRAIIAAIVASLIISFLLYYFWTEEKLPKEVKADKVVVIKSKRILMLMKNGNVLKKYKISLGRGMKGPKRCQGDGRTPEGKYILDWRNQYSKFYLSIHISYPNKADIAQAKRLECPHGGDIMIHGLPNGFRWIGKLHKLIDWTNGCIAVTNSEMDEIWRAVPIGTPIEIRP